MSSASPSAPSLQLDPDRLLPTDPTRRGIARRLFQQVAGLPIISPHGHVPAQWLAQDVPFGDPTSLLLTPDHYATRLLHSAGVDLALLGVGQGPLEPDASRAAFRALCENWSVYRGTPVKYWLQMQFVELFGVDVRPSARTADAIYDQIAATLATPEFRPRALYDRFGVEVLATTDDPCDDLADHAFLAQDPTWSGRVLPTFRPDRYLEVGAPGWSDHADRLQQVSGIDTSELVGFLDALRDRRAHFLAHGAVSADHSHADVRAERLGPQDAVELFALARKGSLQPDEAATMRRHLLWEMARMSAEDGLVMTLHPGVSRNHHGPTHQAFGADVGADIPLPGEFTRALQPLLQDFGTDPNFQLVLFTLDETTLSREIAPLAGFYPSVWVGAPWWFMDAPEAILRHRSAVTETAGFSKTSGFIDDTRAFCSIPARHDMARRLDATYLAGLVADGRLEEDEAADTLLDIVSVNPRKAFRL